MSRLRTTLVIVFAFAIAPGSQAQGPDRPPMPPPNGGEMRSPMNGPGGPEIGPPPLDAASMLLAHTGELKLTDAQVTRLAAIARRTADRRKAMRTSVDSMRAANRPTPSTNGPLPTMRQGPPAMQAAQMEKMREQEHADLRDALTVLTPDQLAQGWEMMASRGGRRGGPPPQPDSQ